MDWKKENVSSQIKEMQKNYIECELMNYYYHLFLRDKYKEMARELQDQYDNELNFPRTSRSIIKLPEKNNNVCSPWQIDLSNRIDCLNLKKELEEQHLYQVDTWLNSIKLTPEQLEVVKKYVMLGKDANKVADETGYSVDNVKKTRERTVKKIYFEFFRKKCTLRDT